jgi:hypothetical protein
MTNLRRMDMFAPECRGSLKPDGRRNPVGHNMFVT